MFQAFRRQWAHELSDWMVDSIQEIVGKIKTKQNVRISYLRCISTTVGTDPDFQPEVTRREKTSSTGFHHQIHGKFTLSPVNLGMAEPEHGGFEVKLTQNGLLLTQVPLSSIHGKR